MRSVLVTLLLAMAAPAAAQAPTGAPLPVATDLARVDVGAWSEYTAVVPNLPSFRQRFALVGRDQATHTVEMTSEGGMLARSRLVLKVVLGDLARPDRIRRLEMQIGDGQPMEMKFDAAATKRQFARLDARKLVDTQVVKVPAGSFRARHYRERGADGETTDYWVSDDAPPLGIVKMSGGGTTVELAARGKGARPIVTKPARPFDPRVLMTELDRAIADGAKK